VNKRRWNELVDIHAKSDEYDLDGFIAGKNSLHSIELDALGDVSGKSLLHFQCHFGLDTLSWGRLGARVTGVDFSDTAIELARSLAARVGVDAEFINCNVYDLPENLDGEFDIVFTSFGALCWLHDMEGWAGIISRYLKPGGTFFMAEFHPFMWVFDYEFPSELKVKYRYWQGEKPDYYEAEGSYADERGGERPHRRRPHHQGARGVPLQRRRHPVCFHGARGGRLQQAPRIRPPPHVQHQCDKVINDQPIALSNQILSRDRPMYP
jgi:SAM-dependent methyltransferase